MNDDEANALLEQLTRHFHEPVMPVSRYCTALRRWRDCVVAAYEESYDPKDPRRARFAHLVPFFRDLELAIVKSALLARLIYEGEDVRTEKCPEHQGHWSGLEFGRNACPHGCQLTGWLPLAATAGRGRQ